MEVNRYYQSSLNSTKSRNCKKLPRRFLRRFTFALKAFFPQDADKGQELGDLFQVQHSGVVELNDGHGLLVVGTAAAILPQTVEQNNTTPKC